MYCSAFTTSCIFFEWRQIVLDNVYAFILMRCPIRIFQAKVRASQALRSRLSINLEDAIILHIDLRCTINDLALSGDQNSHWIPFARQVPYHLRPANFQRRGPLAVSRANSQRICWHLTRVMRLGKKEPRYKTLLCRLDT